MLRTGGNSQRRPRGRRVSPARTPKVLQRVSDVVSDQNSPSDLKVAETLSASVGLLRSSLEEFRFRADSP
jgi:hypothetical protein